VPTEWRKRAFIKWWKGLERESQFKIWPFNVPLRKLTNTNSRAMAKQIISSIDYAPVHSIIGYETYPDSTAKVTVEGWNPLPMNPASGEMETKTREESSVFYFITQIGARLKNNIHPLPQCIFRITMCSGKAYVLGSPFIPVKSLIETTMTVCRFSIEHSDVSGPRELIE